MTEKIETTDAPTEKKFEIPPALAKMAKQVVSAPVTEEAPIFIEPAAEVTEVAVAAAPDQASEAVSDDAIVAQIPETVIGTADAPAVHPERITMQNAVIDLSNLEVVSTNSLIRSGAIDAALNTKSSFMVVCPQSAYMARLTSLCLEDKIRLLNSVDTPFDNRRKLYKIVYDHIQEMNIPKPTFDDFLRITSYHDMETLLFGIYAQTYPGESDFDITCGKCENKIEAKIGSHLMQVIKDSDVYKHLDAVVKSAKPEDVAAASLVHTTSRVLLPESKIVFDIVTPSLSDHLTLLKAFNPKFIADISNIIGMMLFIKQAFVPDTERINTGDGKMVFFHITDRNEILRLTSKLATRDGDKLNEEINLRAKKFQVDYQLPKMVCAACSNDIDAINIDIENVLFSNILGKA